MTLGASYDLTDNVTFSVAWMHGFRNSIEGPILQVPHTSVRLDAQLDTLWAGVNIKFGGSKRSVSAAPAPSDHVEVPPPAPASGSYDPTPPGPGGVESGLNAPDGAITSATSSPGMTAQ